MQQMETESRTFYFPGPFGISNAEPKARPHSASAVNDGLKKQEIKRPRSAAVREHELQEHNNAWPAPRVRDIDEITFLLGLYTSICPQM